MSANLEQHDGRLCVLRVGGELKKSAESIYAHSLTAMSSVVTRRDGASL
jgi:hypothetical protein